MMYNEKNEHEIITHDTINNLKFMMLHLDYRAPHFHSEFEIFLIIEGSLRIESPEESHVAHARQIIVFNPYQIHELFSEGGPCLLLVIQVDPAFCATYFPALRNVRFRSGNINAIMPPRAIENLTRYMYNIGYNYFCHVTGFEFRCVGDANAIFAYLIGYIPSDILQEEEYLSTLKTDKRLERIVNYIRKNYTGKLSLAEIADQEGLSATYLSHFLKDHLGMSFQEYVNALRFEHAVLLLKQTNMKIIDVCLESGFSDSRQLNKQFLQTYHMTPKEFRKNVEFLANEKIQDRELCTTQYAFTREESIRILREHHSYHCDEPGFINHLPLP